MTTTLTPEEIRALTERAALKISLRLEWDGPPDQWIGLYYEGKTYHTFDPAHNDADSRLLARRLRISVDFSRNSAIAFGYECCNQEEFPPNATDDEIGAAERLAVLRVVGAE